MFFAFSDTFTSPFQRIFLIVVFSLMTIPTLTVTMLRHYVINSNKSVLSKLFALFGIWTIFLFILGASLSEVIGFQAQGSQSTYGEYYAFFLAVLVAISFWLIENASKATVEILKNSSITEK